MLILNNVKFIKLTYLRYNASAKILFHMFAKDADINGFLEKQQLKSQKSALNARAFIGMCRERNRFS